MPALLRTELYVLQEANRVNQVGTYLAKPADRATTEEYQWSLHPRKMLPVLCTQTKTNIFKAATKLNCEIRYKLVNEGNLGINTGLVIAFFFYSSL